MKYTFSVPEELIDKARKAAAQQSAKRDRPISVSEWLREAVTLKLEAEVRERRRPRRRFR